MVAATSLGEVGSGGPTTIVVRLEVLGVGQPGGSGAAWVDTGAAGNERGLFVLGLRRDVAISRDLGVEVDHPDRTNHRSRGHRPFVDPLRRDDRAEVVHAHQAGAA